MWWKWGVHVGGVGWGVCGGGVEWLCGVTEWDRLAML